MTKKISSISVRVDPDLKRAFLAAARAHGCSGAQIVRAFIQAIVDGQHNPDSLCDQVRAAVKNPAPARTPESAFQLARRIAAGTLGLVFNAKDGL